MGVTGFCSGSFKTTGNKEKNDPFHLLIELKYQGIWKRFKFLLSDTLEIIRMRIWKKYIFLKKSFGNFFS